MQRTKIVESEIEKKYLKYSLWIIIVSTFSWGFSEILDLSLGLSLAVREKQGRQGLLELES